MADSCASRAAGQALALEGAWSSVAGRRDRNEDRCALILPETGQDATRAVAAVADGVSGAKSGEQAAEAAIGAVQEAADEFLSRQRGAGETLCAIFDHAHAAARQVSERTESAAVTTLTVAVVDGTVLHYGHVGDSRMYLFRGNHPEQITSGTTAADGSLSEAIGYPTPPHVDRGSLCLLPGDRVLLCTDGLAPDGGIDDDQIGVRLSAPGTAAERLQSLVEEAQRRGSQDNITGVLMEFARAEPARPPQEVTAPTKADAGARDGARWGGSAVLLAVVLLVGVVTGWLLRGEVSAPPPSLPGPLGEPELVMTLPEDSRLIGPAPGRGVAVASSDGRVLLLDSRTSAPGQLLGRMSLATGPDGYVVYWAEATHSVVRRTPSGTESVPVPEEAPPDSIVVDGQHNIWLLFAGRLYVVEAAGRRNRAAEGTDEP